MNVFSLSSPYYYWNYSGFSPSACCPSSCQMKSANQAFSAFENSPMTRSNNAHGDWANKIPNFVNYFNSESYPSSMANQFTCSYGSIPSQQVSSYEKVLSYLKRHDIYFRRIDFDMNQTDINDEESMVNSTYQAISHREPKSIGIDSEHSIINQHQKLDQRIKCYYCKKTFKSKGSWFYKHLHLVHRSMMTQEYFE